MQLYKFVLAAITVSGVLEPAMAQTQRSGGGTESQKIMQQYQQLAAERTSLKAQLTQIQADLDKAKAELAASKKERDALKAARGGEAAAGLAQATAARQAAEQGTEQAKQRTAEVVARYRELAQTLKDTELDRNKARNELTELHTAFDSCADHNLQLFEISSQVLDRYEHVGLFTRVSAAEPFTQTTRTRIENLVDDYRARALEMRVKKRAP